MDSSGDSPPHGPRGDPLLHFIWNLGQSPAHSLPTLSAWTLYPSFSVLPRGSTIFSLKTSIFKTSINTNRVLAMPQRTSGDLGRAARPHPAPATLQKILVKSFPVHVCAPSQKNWSGVSTTPALPAFLPLTQNSTQHPFPGSHSRGHPGTPCCQSLWLLPGPARPFP